MKGAAERADGHAAPRSGVTSLMRCVRAVAVLVLSVLVPAQDPGRGRPLRPDELPAAPGGAAVRPARVQIDDLLFAARRTDTVRLWDGLPEGYRAELDGLVRDCGARLDARTCDRAWRLVRRLVQVAIAKQSLAFGSAIARTLVDGDPRRATAAQAAYQALFFQLRDLARSDLATLEGVRTFDGRTFCGDGGKALLDAFVKLAAMSGHDPRAAIEALEVRVVDESAERLGVELTVAGRPVASGVRASILSQFAKVDGRWLPAALVDEWMPAVRRMRAQLAASPARVDPALNARVVLWLTAGEAMLRQIEQADTQTAFDAALQRVMASLAVSSDRRT